MNNKIYEVQEAIKNYDNITGRDLFKINMDSITEGSFLIIEGRKKIDIKRREDAYISVAKYICDTYNGSVCNINLYLFAYNEYQYVASFSTRELAENKISSYSKESEYRIVEKKITQ